VKTEIILQHGWGFDATSWSKWIPALASKAHITLGERGYFGARKVLPTFTEQAERKIVIAHSYGAHVVPKETLREADTLILISSFIDLQSNSRAIRSMVRKFSSAPELVISDFWRNCYTPEYDGISILPPPGMNETALENDLVALESSALNVELISSIPNVVLLQPEADRIVPEDARLHLRGALPHATAIRIGGGCHVVHITQPERCLQFVYSLVTRNQAETCQIQKS
jgi:pimeloyl-[acyl-carrier protein] methyl ester esterase